MNHPARSRGAPRGPLTWLTALIAVFLLACSGLVDTESIMASLDPAPPPDPAWVGVWEGPGQRLVVAADGTILFSKTEGGTTQNLTLPARAWTDDGLTVGIGPVTQTIALQQLPHEVDGEWRIVMRDIVMVRTGPPPVGFGRKAMGVEPETMPQVVAPDTDVARVDTDR